MHGLVAASVYNDQVCLLERYDSLTGRWEVCLRDSCKMVKIKPIHLAAAPSLASSARMSGQPSSPLPRPAFTLSPDALAESAKMLTWLSAAGAPTALSVLTHLHDLCEVCNYLFVAAAEWADGGGNYLRAYVLQMTALLVLLASWSDERLMQCEVESGPGPAAQGLVSPWTLRRLFCQCVATLSRASVSPETLGDDEWRACVSLLSSCCVVLPSGKVEADMTALHQYLLTRDARGMATFVRYRALLYFVLDDSAEGEGGGGDEVPSRVGGCADIGRSAIVDIVKGHWDELEDRPAAVWEILADFAAHNSVFEQGLRGREAKRKLICDLLKM